MGFGQVAVWVRMMARGHVPSGHSRRSRSVVMMVSWAALNSRFTLCFGKASVDGCCFSPKE